MLLLLAIICLSLAGLVVGLQLFWIVRLARLYPPSPPGDRAARAWPRAAVLLPVRGADPSLRDCLLGLLNQDYPVYDVHVIVDSPDDPAWGILREVTQERPGDNLHVELLRDPRSTCSLKVSALLQGLATLDKECAAVVLVDADVIPQPDWLRALIEPLADPRVGATAGVRWYEPGDRGWGTLVRGHWNVAACTQMHAFAIPWAGSMAIRGDVFRCPEFAETWAVSLCDDTGAYPVLRKLGLELRTVPAATMMNRETIGLLACFAFVRRQMLSARLYHPAWPFILVLGLISGLTVVGSVGILVGGLFLGDWSAVACAGITFALQLGGLGGALVWLDGKIRSSQRPPGPPHPRPLSPRCTGGRGVGVAGAFVISFIALLVTQVVYLSALVSAVLLRRVAWRGVIYEIAGPRKVRLVEYRPYRSPTREHGERSSVN
jgi:hypothetical protein